MTLRWPIAEAAQGRREPIYEPDHVFRAFESSRRKPRLSPSCSSSRRSKLAIPIWLLLKDTGLAYRTARFSDHPPLAPPHSSYTIKVQQFARAFRFARDERCCGVLAFR